MQFFKNKVADLHENIKRNPSERGDCNCHLRGIFYYKMEKIRDLPEEVQKEFIFIKENYEKITQRQFDFLCERGVIHKTRNFKSKRAMWVCPDTGKILYLDLYYKKINYCGIFKN